jgi:ParB family chromosome partitioning protein
MKKHTLSEMLEQRAAERGAGVSYENEKSEADIAYDFMFGLAERPPDKERSESGDLIALASLVPYSKHPFKPYPGDKLNAIALSIRENGLQQPVIIRKTSDKQYEILAGHNRAAAFRINGETRIPAIVVKANDDQAAMIVTETNLRQRDKLLPSEKAFAYKLQLDALKHQGKRSDAFEEKLSDSNDNLTCAQTAHKRKSRDAIAERHNTSRDEIRRHIRLTFLIPELLQLIDCGKLAFIAGVELSYLTPEQQQAVHQTCIVEKAARLDLKLAGFIREWTKDGGALGSAGDIENLLREYAATPAKPARTISFKRKTFEPYLARIPRNTDLEKLFAEFLRERFGGG